MNTYFIQERNMDMTYIELRLLLYVECELKYEKITEVLNFLNTNGFLNHLTMFYSENMRAENIPEHEHIMSLTIDMRNDKMRFKFWNGATTMWVFHTQDLFDALSTGREKFSELYDKYEPITEILFNFKKRWVTSIHHISYQYHSDGENDITYNIVFTEEVKNTNYGNKLLDKINKEITMLGKDKTEDLHFNIEFSYESAQCTPCEAAKRKREREQNDG